MYIGLTDEALVGTNGLQIVGQPNAAALSARIRFQNERTFVILSIVHCVAVTERQKFIMA